VKAERAKSKHKRLAAFFGPSAVNAALLQLILGCVILTAVDNLAYYYVFMRDTTLLQDQSRGFSRLASYAFGFFVFVVGFAAWVRARVERPLLARILVIVVAFAVSVVPWVVAAIAGIVTPQTEDGLFVAAPSPFFAFYMVADATKSIHIDSNITAGWVCIFGWGILGVLFLVASIVRSRRIVRETDRAVAETDRRLADEDMATARAEEALQAEQAEQAEAEPVS